MSTARGWRKGWTGQELRGMQKQMAWKMATLRRQNGKQRIEMTPSCL